MLSVQHRSDRSFPAFEPGPEDTIAQVAGHALYRGLPTLQSTDSPQRKASSLFLQELARTGNAPEEFSFVAYISTTDETLAKDQCDWLEFIAESGPTPIRDEDGTIYNVHFRPIIVRANPPATGMLPTVFSTNTSALSGGEELRELTKRYAKMGIPIWVDTDDAAALAKTELEYPEFAAQAFGKLFLANLDEETIPVIGKELLPKAVLQEAGKAHKVFSAIFLTGKAVAATLFLTILSILDAVLTGGACDVASNFWSDLKRIWSYGQMPEPTVNKQALRESRTAFEEESMLDLPSPVDSRATTVSRSNSEENSVSFESLPSSPLASPVAHRSNEEILSQMELQYDAACAYFAHLDVPPQGELRQLLLDVANKYTTLVPETENQWHFLELCKASGLYLFELPKLIYCRDPEEYANLDVHNWLSFQSPPGECLEQLTTDINKGCSLDRMQLPSGNAVVLSKLTKDINRPHGPVVLVQKGVGREIENPWYAAQQEEDPPHRTEAEKAEMTKGALDNLFMDLRTLSSMQGAKVIPPLLQGVIAQLGYSGPGVRYTNLVMAGTNSKMYASAQNGSITTEIQDISPDEIRVVYRGSAAIIQIAEEEVVGRIEYAAPMTLKRVGGQWVDTSFDLRGGESVTLADHDALFARVS